MRGSLKGLKFPKT